VDQAGRLLHVMTYCEGMGTPLRRYPHAMTVLEAHARWDEARTSYLTLVDRTEWCDAARAGLAAADHRLTYVADFVAPELDLRAFPAPDREPSS
jgi:hypothetical protein